MMATDQIQRYSKIRQSALSEEFYFQSLLQEAYARAELSDAELDGIQMQCLGLLAMNTERYTKGESSSVRVETAQSIMVSSLYTVGVYLKSLPGAASALESIKRERVSELYRLGREGIAAKFGVARQLYGLVRATRIDSPNHAYGATIDGMEEFFRLYDADFAAHEAPGSIDYQLLNPVTGFAGVEYMVQYLQSLHAENLLCSRFDSAAIHEVMRGYDEGYEDLLINLCGQVLQNALGCVMLGKDLLSLDIGPSDIRRFKSLLGGHSTESIRGILQKAADELFESLAIRDRSLKEYVRQSLPETASRVHAALETGTLQTVFVHRRGKTAAQAIRYSTGSKMDDEIYRGIVKQVLACRDSGDRIRIIREHVKTLSDMEEIITDGELSEKEALTVFEMLADVEVAVLLRRHPYRDGVDAIGYSEAEMRLRRYLDRYLCSLPTGRLTRVEAAVSSIEDATFIET